MSSNTLLIEQIRKARSINDLKNALTKISKSLSNSQAVVKKLDKSATRLIISMSARSVPEEEEISIDHTGTGTRNRIKKVKIGEQAPAPISAVLTSFKPPKIQSVTEHTDVINNLYDKSAELDAVEALLIQSFADSKGQPAALKGVKELKKNVDDQLSAAFNSLATISDKHLPKEVKALGEELVSYLLDNLEKDSFNDMSHTSYVFRAKDKKWHYTYYVTIEGLRNESGFTFEDYNVVLSAIIDDQKHASYYLTTLADFRVPGKFPLGRSIKSAADIKSVLSIMLRHNDVINVLDKKAMPLTNDKLKSNGLADLPGVKDAYIEDDTLVLTLAKRKTPPAEINQIVTKVLPLLNMLVGNKAKKSVVSYKQVPPGNPTKLEFILVSALKDSKTGLNLDKLHELQHALDLTDDEVDAIKQGMKHH